jgi:2-oxoglutarate ferredoxin oxidoreductase subunit beta
MFNYEKYLRKGKLPLIWCSGCANGIVLKAIIRAIDDLELDQNEVCAVSGIGCSSRATGYLDFNTLHTTHGRALAFATGLKCAKPELHILVITGDGDAASIGGNHLIHAARRDIDLTVVVFNNQIYGMTGGQVSPVTPRGKFAATAPYGSAENAFDICDLVRAAGASYVARSTAYHAKQMEKFIRRGLQTKGFSLVDIMTPCPTTFGKRNQPRNPVDMMRWLQEKSLPLNKAESSTHEKSMDYILTGEYISK